MRLALLSSFQYNVKVNTQWLSKGLKEAWDFSYFFYTWMSSGGCWILPFSFTSYTWDYLYNMTCSEGRNILKYFKSVRQWIPSYLQSSLNQRYCTEKQSAVNVIFQSHYKNLFWKQIHQKNILTAAQNLPKSFSGMASGLTEIKFKWQISYQYYFSAFF